MKADEKYDYQNDGEPAKCTNFEYLMKKVEVLQKEIELISKVLEQNNLVYKETHQPGGDLEDETWKTLEEETE